MARDARAFTVLTVASSTGRAVAAAAAAIHSPRRAVGAPLLRTACSCRAGQVCARTLGSTPLSTTLSYSAAHSAVSHACSSSSSSSSSSCPSSSSLASGGAAAAAGSMPLGGAAAPAAKGAALSPATVAAGLGVVAGGCFLPQVGSAAALDDSACGTRARQQEGHTRGWRTSALPSRAPSQAGSCITSPSTARTCSQVLGSSSALHSHTLQALRAHMPSSGHSGQSQYRLTCATHTSATVWGASWAGGTCGPRGLRPGAAARPVLFTRRLCRPFPPTSGAHTPTAVVEQHLPVPVPP